MSYRSRGLRTRRPSSVEGSPTPLPKVASYLHLAAGWRAPCLGVVVFYTGSGVRANYTVLLLCVHGVSVLSLWSRVWWPRSLQALFSRARGPSAVAQPATSRACARGAQITWDGHGAPPRGPGRGSAHGARTQVGTVRPPHTPALPQRTHTHVSRRLSWHSRRSQHTRDGGCGMWGERGTGDVGRAQLEGRTRNGNHPHIMHAHAHAVHEQHQQRSAATAHVPAGLPHAPIAAQGGKRGRLVRVRVRVRVSVTG